MIRILLDIIRILLGILNLWMEKSIEIGVLYMLVYIITRVHNFRNNYEFLIITTKHYHSIVYNVYLFIHLK